MSQPADDKFYRRRKKPPTTHLEDFDDHLALVPHADALKHLAVLAAAQLAGNLVVDLLPEVQSVGEKKKEKRKKGKDK